MLEMMKTNEAVYIQNWVLGTLHQTASSLMSRLEWNDTLTAILKRAAELVGTKHGFIMILDDSGGYFERQVAMGIFEQDLIGGMSLIQGLSVKYIAAARPLPWRITAPGKDATIILFLIISMQSFRFPFVRRQNHGDNRTCLYGTVPDVFRKDSRFAEPVSRLGCYCS